MQKKTTKREEYDGIPEVKNGTITERNKWNKEKKGVFNYFDKKKLKKEPETAYFITMLFPNGTCKEWVIVGRNVMFSFKGRNFVLDYHENFFDLNQNQFRLFYHFEHAMPLKKEVIPYTDKGHEAYLRIKSDNVAPIIKQEYVKVLASSKIDKYLMLSLVFVGINIFLTFLLIVVVMFLARNVQSLAR